MPTRVRRRGAVTPVTRTRTPNPEFFAAPNNDGPIQSLLRDVAFTSVQTIDFWPDGSAHTMGATVPIGGTGVTLQVYDVTRGTSVNKSITVNGLGKITLQ